MNDLRYSMTVISSHMIVDSQISHDIVGSKLSIGLMGLRKPIGLNLPIIWY